MRKRHLLLIASAVVFALASGADAVETDRFILEGQLSSSSSVRSASVRVLCNPDTNGGAISVELWVPQASKLKDFDYDDFEGPDAAAGDRALSRMSVVGASAKTEIVYAAAGWYSGEDPDTFVFGLSQLSHRQGKIATLLRAVSAQHTQLVWVQAAFGDPQRQLRATFALDAAMVKRVHDTVDACLSPAAKAKSAAEK